jgi:hypothetical protein
MIPRNSRLNSEIIEECWWQGPKFLEKPENEWPERKFGSPSLIAREEVKTEPKTKAKSTFYNQSAQTQTKATWRLDPARNPKWYRTRRGERTRKVASKTVSMSVSVFTNTLFSFGDGEIA